MNQTINISPDGEELYVYTIPCPINLSASLVTVEIVEMVSDISRVLINEAVLVAVAFVQKLSDHIRVAVFMGVHIFFENV